MDLITVFNIVEISEFTLFLDIEGMISLFLTCSSIQLRIKSTLSLLCTSYRLSTQATSFSHLVSLYDKERISRRSAEIIGVNRALARAAGIDSISLMALFLSKDATNTIDALTEACKACAVQAATFLISCQLDDEDPVVSYLDILSYYGYLDLIKVLVKDGCDDSNMYGLCLVEGARGGHIEIVRYALNYIQLGDLPVDDMDRYDAICSAMGAAAASGYVDIVQLMLDSGVDSYDESMSDAANGGHIEIVQLMIEKGATMYISTLDTVVTTYSEDIAKLMDERGILYREKYALLEDVPVERDEFVMACYEGRLDDIYLYLDRDSSISRINSGLYSAAMYGNIDICRLMLNRGATNIDEVIRIATGGCNTRTAEFLERHKGMMTR